MKKIIIALISVVSINTFAQVSKSNNVQKPTSEVLLKVNSSIEKDKLCIKNLCGTYKVTFDFAETFSPDTAYKYHDRYKEWAIEYVFIVEETDKKIALQHILIANDSVIIKHWRQDWVYENTELYNYYKDNEWIKRKLTADEAKGTWTQKVYQVDDSPRYESYGTWIHVDGKNYWEGTCDAPLPRREITKRKDYNVVRRHSRIELLDNGWALFQDNEKINRSNGVDQLLCWEKGAEVFTKGNYDATPAIKYWEKQKIYWADVRKMWDDIYKEKPSLKIVSKVENKRLYEKLFELGDKCCNNLLYNKTDATIEIKKILDSFIKQA